MGTTLSRFYNRQPRLAQLILFIAAIFVLSSLSHPDPSASSLQLPSLLPSRYPPSRHPSNAILDSRLSKAALALDEACPGANEPIYLDPGLTLSQEKRYTHLRKGKGRIMITTTVREIQSQLSDFVNSLIVLTTFLGSERLSFSILEGPSGDCTAEVFEDVVGPTLLGLGIPPNHLHLVTRESKIDFSQHHRIEVLAELRNRALSPLWTTKEEVEAVVFVNDVYLKASDVLELLHQHKRSGAGISTAWDWMERKPEYYYDVWVGRTIDTGNLFYPITYPWWSPSDELFYDSPASKSRFESLKPFQVYSSWNGLAVLNPKPFLPPHNVRFRRGDVESGECSASECGLVATDFWRAGFGRVQVVPSIQLAYTNHVARQTRDELLKQQERLGWTDGVPPPIDDEVVQYITDAPEKVRCHPWPEANGLSHNVWEKTLWVDPLTGVEA